VRETTTEAILMRIQRQGPGWVFAARDFLDIGSRAAVDQTLSRMAAEGSIRRLTRGLYDYPRMSTLLGTHLPAAPEKIAEALARKTGSQLQSIGAKAANSLGLSTQVPARIVYLTDGTSRKIRIGNQTIELRHASPRRMAGAGQMEGTVIQALRHLGEANITPEMIEHLRQNLGKKEKAALRREGFNAPTWLLPILQKILQEITEEAIAA
jgi:hypothetical protein